MAWTISDNVDKAIVPIPNTISLADSNLFLKLLKHLKSVAKQVDQMLHVVVICTPSLIPVTNPNGTNAIPNTLSALKMLIGMHFLPSSHKPPYFSHPIWY